MTGLFNQLLDWWNALSSSTSDIVGLLKSLDPAMVILLAGLGTALELFVVTGFFVPGDVIVLFAASTVHGLGGAVVLILSTTVGAVVGQLAGYGLGRWVGATARGRWLRHHAGERRVSSLERFLRERGGPAILAARFVPLLRAVMPFVVGLAGFRFWRFLAWTVPASLAWSVLYVTVGALAADALANPAWSLLVTVLVALFGLILFVASLGAEQLRERRRVRVRAPVIPAAPHAGD
jgi:membrane-associated protein